MRFLDELKRRKVVRVAVVYAATGFAILQAADLVLPALLLPDTVYRALVILLLLGLPVALVLGWALELTPGGLRRADARAADPSGPPPSLLGRGTIMVTAALVLLGIGLGAGWFLAPSAPAVSAAPATPASEKSLAVLPFADLSEAGDQQWFADGIAEEVLTSLARLPELRVVGRSSSFLFATGEDRAIADSLGVAHLVRGSVRRVGDELRVSAQLVRAADGVQLWSESYDRPAADLLDVQRDVAEKIAAALDVLLDDRRREQMFAAGTRSVEAFEAYLRGREIFAKAHSDVGTLADAQPWFERAMALDPAFAAPAFLHADRLGHYVVDGPPSPVVGPIELTVEEALDRLRDDFRHAANSRDAYTRLLAEINLAFFSSDWRGLPALIERLGSAGPTHTIDDPWGRHVPIVLGRIELAREMAAHATRWDPLNPIGWDQRIQVELAAGDLTRARQLITEAKNALLQPQRFASYERYAAILSGELHAVLPLLSPFYERTGYAAAIRGDTAAAVERARAFDREIGWPDTRLLLVYHQIGDRERSRELAARIDAMPAGPVMLLRELSLTGAALTFDPADTPNFSARLREAGVDPSSLRTMPPLGAPASVQ
jgi:TolB-like protein